MRLVHLLILIVTLPTHSSERYHALMDLTIPASFPIEEFRAFGLATVPFFPKAVSDETTRFTVVRISIGHGRRSGIDTAVRQRRTKNSRRCLPIRLRSGLRGGKMRNSLTKLSAVSMRSSSAAFQFSTALPIVCIFWGIQ